MSWAHQQTIIVNQSLSVTHLQTLPEVQNAKNSFQITLQLKKSLAVKIYTRLQCSLRERSLWTVSEKHPTWKVQRVGA